MLYRKYGKRLFDLLVSTSALGFFLPVFAPISVLVVIEGKGSPFFSQPRPGLKGRIFKVIKFRTMNNKVGQNGALLPPSQRITRLGRFLRSTSLDELPQLINVIMGDMSVVGPRPLRVEYLPVYSEEQARRHEVKPGITGWAQVNGRNAIEWEDKFRYDVWYVDNFCFLLDMKILLLTLWKILRREGVERAGGVTMSPFKGVKLDG